jgi:hypothetical protein
MSANSGVPVKWGEWHSEYNTPIDGTQSAYQTKEGDGNHILFLYNLFQKPYPNSSKAGSGAVYFPDD